MKNIKVVFSDYREFLNTTEDMYNKVESRFCSIHDIYLNFVDIMKLNDRVDIMMNDRVLIHAIMDYFSDIARLKEFHNIDLVNRDKVISYESSWLLRRKPIQILNVEKEDLVYINEKFVLTILVNHLTNGSVSDISSEEILSNFCDALLYYFKFRNYEPKVIEMLIMAFKAGNSLDTIKYS